MSGNGFSFDSLETTKSMIQLTHKAYRTMEIKAIKTEEDYIRALQQLEEVFDSPANSAEGELAEVLSILIENYEDQHYPIEAPDPIEAIKYRMEQMNMSNKDLAEVIGYKSRVSEVLNRKRKLSLNMIRQLHKKLRIPYDNLLTEYE